MFHLKILLYFYIVYFVRAIEDSTNEPVIYGIIPLSRDGEPYFNGSPLFASNDFVKFVVFGDNLHENVHVGISKQTDCEYVEPCELTIQGPGDHHAIMSLTTPDTGESFLKNVQYYVCVRDRENQVWIRQEINDTNMLYVYKPVLTTVVYILIIIFCFSLSSLMSGLNIGLMSLDLKELHLLKNAGTIQERRYARKIIPVRRNGNFLLCSILITSTMCNSVATVFIDNFVSDYVTVVIVTIIIVLFCEILPQSICTYFPLVIGANTVCLTRLCMFLTAPMSYPLSLILKFILGQEISANYTKARLKELLKMTELPTEEQKIITGTLDLSQKIVSDAMTLLDDVFAIPITSIMDFETVALILSSGYSRIPIYVGKKSNILYLLLTKELALLDPDDKVPVKMLVQHSKYKCRYISANTPLDEALVLFRNSRGHMAFIVDDKQLEDEENEKHVIGLITFEDVIEEIFQAEINDETDTFLDNRTKRKITGVNTCDWVAMLAHYTRSETASPSENQKLATFHFLSGIDAFSVENISPKVLVKLLHLDVFYSAPGQKLPQDSIYVQSVPADFFVMVIEGQMEVKMGVEDFKFEVGPFKYFGEEALKTRRSSFKPDYSLRVVTKTLYLKVSKVLYDAAVLATKFERFNETPDISIKSELYKYYKQLVDNNDEKIK
uniref:CNNM transmembrane domain-containing protein n=1 Tax=Cuerna arida TaxID=1464854 RepID=A0A1B6H289_9HEMI